MHIFSSRMFKGLFFFSIISFTLSSAVYSWPTLNGVAISSSGNDEYSPQLVSDGTGGAIIAYTAGNGTDSDIYAKRVNSTGSTLWGLNGVAIATTSGDQVSQQIVSDGAGGAIITWQDNRDAYTHIFAQRVNSSGSTLWAANGLAVSTTTSNQGLTTTLPDGSSGEFIVWTDSRSGVSQAFTQRLNGNGSTLWTLGGVAISTSNITQSQPVMVGDGSGGIIVAFIQNDFTQRIYAMRLNSNGSTLWADDTMIAPGGFNEDRPAMISDGSGGAIITWQDTRLLGTQTDIYSQRIDSSGSTFWTTNGISICTTLTNQIFPRLISDGIGGAIITWQDYRNTTTSITNGLDLYAQRVDSSGSTLWTLDGVMVCTSLNDQINHRITSDSSNGAFITWQDYRSTTASPTSGSDIYAQHINSSGISMFTLNGNVYCATSTDQLQPQIINDGLGGGILAWTDSRSISNLDVYAQSFNSSGVVPVELSNFEADLEVKK